MATERQKRIRELIARRRDKEDRDSYRGLMESAPAVEFLGFLPDGVLPASAPRPLWRLVRACATQPTWRISDKSSDEELRRWLGERLASLHQAGERYLVDLAGGWAQVRTLSPDWLWDLWCHNGRNDVLILTAREQCFFAISEVEDWYELYAGQITAGGPVLRPGSVDPDEGRL